MARRQDSGSNAAHQNQRPTSQNDDAVPEMTDETRGRATDEDDDEFEETEDLDEEEADEDVERE